MSFKKHVLKNKNNKFLYYLQAVLRELVPRWWCRRRLHRILNKDWGAQADYIRQRVDYYNKLAQNTTLSSEAIAIADYRIPKKIRVYYFDSMEYLRFFDPQLKFELIPGDVTHVPSHPALLKSRPVHGDNSNSVILKLNKTRHFNFIKDDIPFAQKKDQLVGRSGFNQPHRKLFFDQYCAHPLCDVKKVSGAVDNDFLTIEQHLQYKFILALEGNDVATNLKWIMSSNSIAVMPRPTYETWFMEGALIPGYHYICIANDYSDLEDKLRYYIAHPEAAATIVENAHRHVEQFKDRAREDAISLLVLQKYFDKTNLS